MRYQKIIIKIGLLMLSSLLVVGWLLMPSFVFAQQGPQPLPPEYASQVPQKIKDQLTQYTGSSFLISAKKLGVTKIAGKDITAGVSPPGNAKGNKLNDVGIGVDPAKHENEPTVAVNPKDKMKLVAGSHSLDERAFTLQCVAYTSADSGATWSAPIIMPQLTPSSACSDPVLAYAPDGRRVYYAYMDIKHGFILEPTPTFTIDLDIVESYSDDNGATWTGPIVALDGEPTIIVFNPPPDPPTIITSGFDYDKPWIGTHIDETGSNQVYVTATRFDEFEPFDCHIAFTRSSDKGVSWNSPTLLDSSSGGCGNPVLVQGSRPTGGLGGNVLVAWYNSGDDGFLNGNFKIRTRSSADNGASFGPAVDAVTDSFEVPFWLGPSASYHRWSGAMFPDVEIDSEGKAHIVYTHDPVANPSPDFSDTPEDGDIRYISSFGPPYNTWSPPSTVNDDGLEIAQGYAALETLIRGKSSMVHVTWEDHRLSPAIAPNIAYDIFYSTKLPGQSVGWLKNFRVSDASSISDFVFIGDYTDLTANDDLLFTIWTDRRHQNTIFKSEDNVFGSRIITGGGTP